MTYPYEPHVWHSMKSVTAMEDSYNPRKRMERVIRKRNRPVIMEESSTDSFPVFLADLIRTRRLVPELSAA